MTDDITALITEARTKHCSDCDHFIAAMADALEAEHKRAIQARQEAATEHLRADKSEAERDRYRAEAESARKTGERILADALRYRAALDEAVSYIDGHWLAPFRPGETAHELRAILTRALNEGAADA